MCRTAKPILLTPFLYPLNPPWLFLDRIKASGLKLRFCTNETQATREEFVKKLQGLGFDISVAEVTAPAPAACRILKERNLRPHLLVHDGGTTLQQCWDTGTPQRDVGFAIEH